MTMRQLQQRVNARVKQDTTKGPREIPSCPDCAARALAGELRCRYCGVTLLADGEGGWSCPQRDRHAPTSHRFSASYGNRDYCRVCGDHRAAHPVEAP